MMKEIPMKLIGIKKYLGTIRLESGLHIGAGDLEMRIGGTDKPVVLNPYTNEPYIPGSSIKGKVRALLELRSGLMHKTEGKPLAAKNLKALQGAEREEASRILRLFGSSGADADPDIGPVRAGFGDCFLTEDCRHEMQEKQMPLTEIKAETAIDRITGTAQRGSLRLTERAIAGLAFDFSISLKVFEGDDDLETTLLDGLKLLENDALGGSGSRGYGRIRILFADDEVQQRFNQTLTIKTG
jgi:CRISPR-associated protein Csm3